MPVHLDRDHNHSTSPGWLTQSRQSLHIGLVNNMPETAFKATQRQFVSLLDAASGDIQVRLSLYTLPGLSKSESSVHNGYSNVDVLFDTHLDGLIVTGREPTTSDLRDEPYWESFTQVLEWAQQHQLNHLVLSGRACSSAAHGWHQSSQALRQALRGL
jgi:homoserine O-succinyltransferase